MAVGKRKRSDGAGDAEGEADTKGSSSKNENPKAVVDATAVFIRGLPKGTADQDLRTWLEGRIGPTVTCFMIRDDYGLAKFKDPNDSRRCLQELQGADFQGSTLRLEAAKQKKRAAGDVVESAPKKRKKQEEGTQDVSVDEGISQSGDLRSIELRGVPPSAKKASLQAWIEERLPGGCGLENVRRVLGEGADDDAGGGGSFVVTFRKQMNASRALESLNGADLDGHRISATYRSLALSKSSSKAGRLIIRNLAFSATEKQVRKAFEKIGALEQVHLPLKKDSEVQHRGFAFVQYKNAAVAEKAISELNGSKVCGRGVAVDWAVDTQLYGSLQKEEQVQQQQKVQHQAKNDKKLPEQAPKEDDDEDDEGEKEEGKDEVIRMKKLLNGDGDDKDDEDEKEDEEEDEEEDDAENDDEDDDSKKDKKKSKKKAKAKVKAKEERKPGFDVEQGCSIFVRNVPFDATAEDLQNVFKRFGRVASIKMVADRTGVNAHRGSCFVKFKDVEGSASAMAAECEADRKLRELSAVVRKNDMRELPAVDGFGISCKGRRLVLKEALAPDEMERRDKEKKESGKKDNKEDKREWMHLLNVGKIVENSEKWTQLSKSEQRQRIASQKERKYRIGNPNFAIDPLRISVRNLPRGVDVAKLRDAVVGHLSQHVDEEGVAKAKKRKAAEQVVQKVSLVRDEKRKATSGDGSERRSKGFGFVAFTDHSMAMKTLLFLNDNPNAFGGGRRPIVEFAVEDKRKLRMQQELFRKHAHKLKPELQDEGAKRLSSKGKGKGKDGAKLDVKGNSEWEPKKTFKKKNYSRGARQREKKRQSKLDKVVQTKQKAVSTKNWTEMSERRAAQKASEMVVHKKAPKKRDIPDAGLPPTDAKRPKKAKVGQLSDDFELRAMNRFRVGAK